MKIKIKQKLFNFFNKFKEKTAERRRRKIEYLKMLKELRYTTKILNSELISDTSFIKKSFWNKIKGILIRKHKCLVVIHYPDNIDVIREFCFVKPFMLDINGKYYLFSPKSFRYINQKAKLEFYYGIPYAVLHNVTQAKDSIYCPPSIDTDAFTSVQNSKFIQDAVKGDEDKMSGIIMILLILMVLVIVGMIILGVNIFEIKKYVKP